MRSTKNGRVGMRVLKRALLGALLASTTVTTGCQALQAVGKIISGISSLFQGAGARTASNNAQSGNRNPLSQAGQNQQQNQRQNQQQNQQQNQRQNQQQGQTAAQKLAAAKAELDQAKASFDARYQSVMDGVNSRLNTATPSGKTELGNIASEATALADQANQAYDLAKASDDLATVEKATSSMRAAEGSLDKLAGRFSQVQALAYVLADASAAGEHTSRVQTLPGEDT